MHRQQLEKAIELKKKKSFHIENIVHEFRVLVSVCFIIFAFIYYILGKRKTIQRESG